MRLLLRSFVASALLLAWAAPDAQDTPAAPIEGFSCDRCQREPGMPCYPMAPPKADVIVEANGAMAAAEDVSCSIDDPPPDTDSKCVSTRTWRFESIRFLNGAPPATASDTFQAATYYDYISPERRRGIVLQGQTRYLIFAWKARSDSTPRANWRMGFACELPPGK